MYGTLGITGRQIQVLTHLVEGETNKAIARALHISPDLVKLDLKSITKRLRLRNRTQAAVWAVHNLQPEAQATVADA
jgi:two-component system nitrate/nitrite response regulator NarL